jgi:acyl-homoserine-lactone acylase
MFGDRNLTAEQERAAVVAMCRANPTLTAGNGQLVDVSQACTTLAGWDAHGNAESRGAFLWRKFMDLAGGPNMWLVPFDPADPTRTTRPQHRIAQRPARFRRQRPILCRPRRPRQRPTEHCAALRRHPHPRLRPTGRLLQRDLPARLHLPAHVRGACRRAPGTGNEFAEVNQGSSLIMAVELTKSGPHARTFLTYGQSANPASPWYTDQTRLYAAKQCVTTRFTEPEILHDPNLTIRILLG